MREVQAGNVGLNALLTVCPGNKTNCSNNPNSNITCDSNTISENLATALNRMMVNSDNQSTNAVQEFFGGGDAAAGRNLMNQTGNVILGLSNQTILQHKFACGNITNNPFNTSTLTDLGKIYEEIGEDNNVLSDSSKVSFYALMRNETNDNGFIADINNIVDQENQVVGLSASLISSFKNQIKSARKPGNVSCCFSNAGWLQLPLSNGSTSQQYVFAVFIDNFTFNNVDMNEIAAEMLRNAIRNSLETWSQA
jgi:hypothetical protein